MGSLEVLPWDLRSASISSRILLGSILSLSYVGRQIVHGDREKLMQERVPYFSGYGPLLVLILA